MIIQHGLPNHNYFAIAVPRGTAPKVSEENPTQEVTLRDPKSGEKHKAQLVAKWLFTMEQLYFADGFCRLTYGVSSKRLHKHLISKFSNLKEIEFLLLKKPTE